MSTFHQLLSKLSDKITPDNVEEMTFYLQVGLDVGEAKLTDCKTALDVFRVMMKRDLLQSRNTRVLSKLFWDINRKDLYNITEEYVKTCPEVPAATVQSSVSVEAEGNIPLCQMCDKQTQSSAIQFCGTCDTLYCKNCLEKHHPKSASFAGHTLRTVGEYLAQIPTRGVTIPAVSAEYKLRGLLLYFYKRTDEKGLHLIKFLVKGILEPRIVDLCTTVLDVFEQLMIGKWLSVDNITILGAFVWHTENKDLYNKLVEYSNDLPGALCVIPPEELTVSGCKHVQFHLKGEPNRGDAEILRSRVADLLCVPKYMVVVVGREPTGSWCLTFRLPNICAEKLVEILTAHKEWFYDLPVYIISIQIDKQMFSFKGTKVSRADPVGLHQIPEMVARKFDSSDSGTPSPLKDVATRWDSPSQLTDVSTRWDTKGVKGFSYDVSKQVKEAHSWPAELRYVYRSFSYRSKPTATPKSSLEISVPDYSDLMVPSLPYSHKLRAGDTLEKQRFRSVLLSGRMMTSKNEPVHRTSGLRVNFKWKRGVEIGRGGFGNVYTAVNMDTSELMAVKEIKCQPNEQQMFERITELIKKLEALQLKNVVKYYGVERHKDVLLIFMEYCGGGTIEDAAKLGLPEDKVGKYTRGILVAVHSLHDNGIVHRDIKGANIFLTFTGCIKLGDFGCAARLKSHVATPDKDNALVGTIAYMAPEVITGKERNGKAADIWSLGCVVLEMCTGKRPWLEYENVFEIVFKVGCGSIPVIPENLSAEGKEFLDCCFKTNPNERATSSDLLSLPFVMVNDKVDDPV